ncbi:hypothetical protein BJ138DRAFT_981607, partial [Hygrophoropsis aurantiaca]
LWSSWYSRARWPLWARSASRWISRTRTTMNAKNHFKQLKHEHLHHLLRPRVDQLVWILCTKVTPAYMQCVGILEDTYRLGRSKKLSPFQFWFKQARGRQYQTSVPSWTCDCGHQKFNAYHLCKHLVQGVSPPLPPSFFRQVVRRHTTPLYRHSNLRSHLENSASNCDSTDGETSDGACVTDGDDHVWTGDRKTLEG